MAKTVIKNWSKEAVSALIEIYKNNECLYNVKSVDYYNRKKGRNALAEMVTVVSKFYANVTEEDCKKKYQSLRNQFCKEYTKLLAAKGKSGLGIIDLYTPKLWCYDQLVFLKDSIYQKKGTYIGCNIEEPEYSMDEEKKEMSIEFLEEAVEDYESSNQEQILTATPKTCQKRKIESVPCPNPMKKSNPTLREGKSSPSPGSTSSRGTTPEAETQSLSRTIQMYIKRREEKRADKVEKDKYTAFGDFVGSWLRDNKNKENKKKCMHDILGIIMKYEMEDTD